MDRPALEHPATPRPADAPALPPQTAQTAQRIAFLVHTYSPLLFRVARSILRGRPEAEDVVQETFLRVLGRRADLGTIRDPRVWLVCIAWNLALDRRRAIRPNPPSARSSSAPAPVPQSTRHLDVEVLLEPSR